MDYGGLGSLFRLFLRVCLKIVDRNKGLFDRNVSPKDFYINYILLSCFLQVSDSDSLLTGLELLTVHIGH